VIPIGPGEEVKVEFPKRMDSLKSEEEEVKDKVVKLEDILGDVYSLKFKKNP
jgi:hypothetical protein